MFVDVQLLSLVYVAIAFITLIFVIWYALKRLNASRIVKRRVWEGTAVLSILVFLLMAFSGNFTGAERHPEFEMGKREVRTEFQSAPGYNAIEEGAIQQDESMDRLEDFRKDFKNKDKE